MATTRTSTTAAASRIRLLTTSSSSSSSRSRLPYGVMRPTIGSRSLPTATRFQVTAIPTLYGLNSLAHNNADVVRSFSSNTSSDSGGGKRDAGKAGGGGGGEQQEAESTEIVLTPGQKVVAGTRLTMWAGIFCFASACAYYIGKELLPTKMSPNVVFDKATAVIRDDAEVKRRFGEPLKVYGRDHGGHREGRRNFIEHTEYTDKDDGSKRTRYVLRHNTPDLATFQMTC